MTQNLIGVITPYNRQFEAWVKEIGAQLCYPDSSKFIKISRMDDISGRDFQAIEKGYQYWEVDEDIYNAALLRIRKNNQL